MTKQKNNVSYRTRLTDPSLEHRAEQNRLEKSKTEKKHERAEQKRLEQNRNRPSS